MGSRQIYHEFNHFDWQMALEELRERAREMNGYRDGYSGDIQSCNDIRLVILDKQNYTQQWLNAYIEEWYDRLGSREGICLRLKFLQNCIITPTLAETYYTTFDTARVLREARKMGGTSAIVTAFGSIISVGKQEEIINKVCSRMASERFKKNYYVVTPNKLLYCNWERSTRKSKYSVELPVYKFILFGWAAV